MKPLAILLLLAASLGCSHPSAGPPTVNSEASEKATQRKEDADDFASGKEARAWLADDKHVLFKASKEGVSKLVGDLYAAGAPELRFGKIVSDKDLGDREFAGVLIAKLPTEPATRNRVFEAMNAFWKQMGDDPVKDEGQEFAGFMLD
ncbi:MAG: hypothetical protein HYR64_05510 [Fimbriimonas ginsengisoli]|uniref:Uncharacterized protein n=1 Tax=Fimbriimonas ginsengisoli TaxID=1005039 RepID=A0A931LVD5_FIMGI|nr:hypothetical protein [Fimbriimonas ginsengisoli]